ncbi:MAG: TIGR03936 family radical SAM-associated protein [Clostridia bacterium]|nr:TIGR03936 family radical SAM-associated protein [Clostridia bacterium]
MSSLRAKFIRGEEVKYISHLDLMQVCARAIRRAHIPIAYSQGFNPHPQMVFGLPMSVGVTSEAEYAEFDFSSPIEPDDFVERLNKELPAGLQIVEAKAKKSKGNIMALITTASYDILVSSTKKMGINNVNQKLDEFLSKPALIVKKEGKKGVRDVDIKPMIYRLKAEALKEEETGEEQEQCKCSNPVILEYMSKLSAIDTKKLSYEIDNMFCLSMLLSAGAAANLKPDLLVAAINETSDIEIKLVKVHRTGLFVGKEGRIIDPLDPAVL